MSVGRLFQQQGRFPAHTFRAGPEFFQCPVLNLADSFFTDAEQVPDLTQAMRAASGQTEPQIENFSFSGAEVFHQEFERFLTFVALLLHQRSGIRHRLGQLEIAVVIEDGIQADGSAGGGLEVVEVFEAAASALGQFLRAGQVLPTVGQSFGFLLEEAEFLQVVRAETDEVALASHGNLERLPNPPSRIGSEPRAVRHVKAVDRLHQPADGFLQKVGVAEAMVAEPFGDVGREADIGGGEAMFVVDVAIVQASHRHDFAGGIVTVVSNELGHGPGFEWWFAGPEIREVPNQDTDEFTFAIPEAGQKLALFFGCEEVRRKGGQRRLRDLGRRNNTFPPGSLHSSLPPRCLANKVNTGIPGLRGDTQSATGPIRSSPGVGKGVMEAVCPMTHAGEPVIRDEDGRISEPVFQASWCVGGWMANPIAGGYPFRVWA